MTITSNISHSITTSTNRVPQTWYNTRYESWYNTRSSPQLEIHSHRVPFMRILDLILLTSLVLILLTRLSLILLANFTIQRQHLNHMRIHRTLYESQVWLDITHKSEEWLLMLYNQHSLLARETFSALVRISFHTNIISEVSQLRY